MVVTLVTLEREDGLPLVLKELRVDFVSVYVGNVELVDFLSVVLHF